LRIGTNVLEEHIYQNAQHYIPEDRTFGKILISLVINKFMGVGEKELMKK
jgi:hypothetical protein